MQHQLLSAQQFRESLKLLGLTYAKAGEVLGRGKSTIAAYGAGTIPVPGPVALLLRIAVTEKLTGRPAADVYLEAGPGRLRGASPGRSTRW